MSLHYRRKYWNCQHCKSPGLLQQYQSSKVYLLFLRCVQHRGSLVVILGVVQLMVLVVVQGVVQEVVLGVVLAVILGVVLALQHPL